MAVERIPNVSVYIQTIFLERSDNIGGVILHEGKVCTCNKIKQLNAHVRTR